MRPDRIIVGEVRSSEVLDMIQAMNTGHDGSMTTLHANSPFDALDRLEVLALMSSQNMSSEVAKRQIISAVDLVIQMARMLDGTRKILEISEVVKGKEYILQEIFVEDGGREGKLNPSGKVPKFYQRLKKYTNYTNKAFE
jgi:pilus assembly protein CpaF